MSRLGPGYRVGWLHLISHQLLVGHAVGEHALALIQPLDSVGLEVDVAGNVLDVLHVCPEGSREPW